MSFLPSAIAGAGLIGGYAVARSTKNRQLGGAVLAAAGTGAFLLWKANAGVGTAAALTTLYVGAFGASHPLAKKIGAWPAVNSVTAGVVITSLVAGRKK
ncbi:hypothetical protein [Paeniglutamicibacter terrestris]|uniref:Uncharacterized protein n=1 Tax=Paeniglutamicibacter terrestris TaxID=2723403 RepID=A0ABX1G7W1_9MICC|nr:hypothetical protein [Paeniglutamicibacter terrestris]ASN40370.1 hypothetical protein CGQ24_16070 [Arthrobacter sp. 7749]NKG21735.1 hypothetical protein [Paeniglutamicibacter terrestris]